MKIGWPASWLTLPCWFRKSFSRRSDIAAQTAPNRLSTLVIAPDRRAIAVAWTRSADPGAADRLAAHILGPLGWTGSLQRTALGAPDSDWLRSRGLSLSLSHAEGVRACAVARGGAVGVDVEVMDPSLDVVALAQMQLDAAAAMSVSQAAGGARLDRFLRLWTLKEAALKALGVGFATPADLAISLDPPTILGTEISGFGWEAREIACGSAHRMAAALLAPPGPALSMAVEELPASGAG